MGSSEVAFRRPEVRPVLSLKQSQAGLSPAIAADFERVGHLEQVRFPRLRPLQNSPKSPKFPSRHLGDLS